MRESGAICGAATTAVYGLADERRAIQSVRLDTGRSRHRPDFWRGRGCGLKDGANRRCNRDRRAAGHARRAMTVVTRLTFLVCRRCRDAIALVIVAGVVRLQHAKSLGRCKNTLDRRSKADREDYEQAKELAAHTTHFSKRGR